MHEPYTLSDTIFNGSYSIQQAGEIVSVSIRSTCKNSFNSQLSNPRDRVFEIEFLFLRIQNGDVVSKKND